MARKQNASQWALHIIFIILTAASLLPFLLLVTASITDENEIIRSGYSFFPKHISFASYLYLFNEAEAIVRAYGISILVTVSGTIVGLAMTILFAYPISRRDMPFRNSLSFYVFFTLLFNGGLVPTYLVYTQLFDLKNTIFALLLPYLLLNGFYVLVTKTFFTNSIPVPVIESAYMDGAGEFRTFFQIVMPLSLPIMATIGLFQVIHYWNDWFNGLIFITDSKLYSLQFLLNKILLDIQFLNSSDLGGNQAEMIASLPKEGVRMAMAVIGIIPLLVAYPFFQKYFVKGLTIGAVKG
ncbi:carbohydrate ABC transporter permease [Paenibacillus cremeus]|uniref:Carbohydrate ABC transporter permease n=1 Tax=Paenibacillus cremeus TaxID=2163881 RepID=A0A559K8I9_9BACL|nr:carbohydrate ABC transporter permease [Paenibacillus cremeus]TVY08403.1 carbohydrate ABC transporter permease [Paenibacillus cremeus]